jgi:hypothetical protein
MHKQEQYANEITTGQLTRVEAEIKFVEGMLVQVAEQRTGLNGKYVALRASLER